jgi:hypothetical protein
VLEHLLAVKAAAKQQQQQLGSSSGDAAAAITAAVPPPAAICGAPTAGSAAAQTRSAASSQPHAAAQDAETAAALLRYENQLRAALAAGGQPGGATFDHIRSLSDVFAVHPTPARQGAASLAGGVHEESGSMDAPSPWVCPVTHLPCGSQHAFSALRPCGHVLSDRALAAILPAGGGVSNSGTGGSSSGKAAAAAATAGASGAVCVCPVCDTPFHPASERVLINGSVEHMDAVRAGLRAKQAAHAQAKQQQQKKKRAREVEEQQGAGSAAVAIEAAAAGPLTRLSGVSDGAAKQRQQLL